MRLLYWTQVSLHALVSLIWWVLPLVWPDKVVWFQSGLLVPTHVTTGVLLLFPWVHAARRYGRTMAGILDLVGLVPIGLYIANLLQARALTPTATDPVTLVLAHTLWRTEEPIAITVLVLLFATGLVHLFVVVATIVAYCTVSVKDEEDAVRAHKLRHARRRTASASASASDSDSL